MLRVLVADDSTDIRTLVRITLSSQGWVVTEAGTPADAVAVAARERPDAIVLDVIFEGASEDGIAVCRRLREMPETARTPIVMLTAQTSAEFRERAQAAGATAYLAKPFGPIELIATVRGVFDVRSSAPPLGLLLIEEGKVSAAQLAAALDEQRRLAGEGVRIRLGEVLVRQRAVGQADIDRALERQREVGATAEASAAIRVLIADDHLAVRDGLRSIFADDDAFQLVGIASDGHEALELIRSRRPDVAILDHEMPKRTGIEVLQAVQTERIPTSVVMFSFDTSLRERALRAGAVAFLPKDTQPRDLTAAVRRAGGTRGHAPRQVSVTGAIAASHTAWRVVARQRRAALTIGVAGVLYAGAFLLAEPIFGASASFFGLGAVALVGALLGPETGAVAGLLSAGLTALLWYVTGHERGEAILTIGANGLGVLATVAVGAGFGVMRMWRGRIDPRDRQIDSILDSSLLFSGGRPEMLELATEAARQMVRADALLLYASVADGDVRVVAASGAPKSVVGHRETATFGPVRRGFAQGRPRALDESEASSVLTRMRSGVAVPAAPVGDESQGLMVALTERRQGLGMSDAATLARIAPTIWLALRIASRQEWWAPAAGPTVRRSRETRVPGRASPKDI